MQRAYPTRGIRFLAVTFITAAVSYQVAAADVFTDPVGFMTTPITNLNNGYNSVALPFQTMRADAGVLTAVSVVDATHQLITAACATCAGTNYALATALHYVEFRTGNAMGHRYSVSADTATSITLQTGTDDLTSGALALASGDKWVIHPYWRIQDVFGPAFGGPLFASNNAARSDNVLVWNGSGFTQYWPKNNGAWQNGAGTDPLLADESMLILRRSATAVTNLITMGEVRMTNFVSVLGSGFNLMGNSFPSSTALSNMNLIGSGSGFLGGNNAGQSDQVLVWNGVGFDALWYKTNAVTPSWQGLGGGGYQVLPTSTYFVQLKGTHHGIWPRPLPYPTTP